MQRYEKKYNQQKNIFLQKLVKVRNNLYICNDISIDIIALQT